MAHTVSILLSTEDRAGIVVFLGDCKRIPPAAAALRH
jgi:hypothetical protein